MFKEQQLIESFKQTLDAMLSQQNASIHKFAIAISGGSDSIALSILSMLYAKEHNIEVCGLIVDHKLRSESTDEALHVREMLKRYGILSEILTWQHEGIATKIQECARDARYQLMLDYCVSHNFYCLLLGHTADDQLETFWMRLNNSSGLQGLSGMKECSTRGDVTLLRPLLNFRKEDLQFFLKQRGVSWIEDPSNQNEKFERIRIRKAIQSLMQTQLLNQPKVQKSLNKLNDAQEFIDFQVHEFKKNQGSDYFNLNDFLSLHPYLQKEVLLSYLKDLSSKKYVNSSEAVIRINSLLGKSNFQRTTFAGLIIEKKKGVIFFKDENRAAL